MVNILKLKKLLFILLVLVSTYKPTLMAEPNCKVSINQTTGAQDDLFEIEVSMESGSSSGQPQIEHSPDFSVESGGTQSFTQIINGQVKSRQIYKFLLTPNKSGKLTTPKITCLSVQGTQVPGKQYVLEVGKSMPKVIMQQSASELSAFEGQQIKHSLEIKTKVKIYDLGLSKPTVTGAWIEDLYEGPSKNKNISDPNVQTYLVESALFPLQAGILNLKPQSATAKIKEFVKTPRRNSLSIFDIDPFDFGSMNLGNFGQARVRTIEISSNPLEIEIKKLPEFPANMSNWSPNVPVVGNTKLELIQKQKSISYGDSLTLTLRIQSEGNLNPITSIPSEFLNDPNFSFYQDVPVEKKENVNGVLLTTKEFSLSLVPKVTGKIALPEFEFGYFDPVLESYRSASTGIHSVEIRGKIPTASDNQGTQLNSSNLKIPEEAHSPKHEDVKPLESVSTYQEPTFLQRIGEQISVSLAILIVFAVLLALFALSVATFFLSKYLAAKSKYRKIKSIKDPAQLREYVLRALTAKLQVELLHLSVDAVIAALRRTDLDPDLLLDLEYFLRTADRLAFSKAEDSYKHSEELTDLAIKILSSC